MLQLTIYHFDILHSTYQDKNNHLKIN